MQIYDLTDLQNDMAEQFKRLKNMDINDVNLTKEIQRHLSLNEGAKTMITNGALMAKCLEVYSGLDAEDIPEGLPLIPVIPAPKDKQTKPAVAGKKQALLNFPRAAEG